MSTTVSAGQDPDKTKPVSGRYGNRLLDALPAEAAEALLQHATALDLPMRTMLYSGEGAPKNLYLLTSGLASVVYTSERGNSIELATIGREGIVGWLSILGGMTQASESMMQMGGAGYKVSTANMQQVFEANPYIRHRVLEFAQQQTLSAYQLVACNRLHQAGERFARWMLMVSDRVGKVELPMTQEFLANMLGTRRTTVAEEAAVLQRDGAIEYSRGVVRILNRALLEERACECYGIVKKQFDLLYGSAQTLT